MLDELAGMIKDPAPAMGTLTRRFRVGVTALGLPLGSIVGSNSLCASAFAAVNIPIVGEVSAQATLRHGIASSIRRRLGATTRCPSLICMPAAGTMPVGRCVTDGGKLERLCGVKSCAADGG